MSELAARPRDPVVGRPIPHETPHCTQQAPRSTPTISPRGPLTC